MSLDWRGGTKRVLLALILSPIVLAVLYSVIVFNWSFSDGDRVGYLQKFSHKGWICKTYEGELAMTTVPGLAPVIWDFSVWDESVATKVNALLGKKVQLHYREYRGLPTDCFGATDYFVDRVEPVE
jgi:hypothetical protein